MPVALTGSEAFLAERLGLSPVAIAAAAHAGLRAL